MNIHLKENKLESDAKIAQIKKIKTMQKLIGNVKLLTKDVWLLIKKVVNTCETCIKFCKPNPRPVVAFIKPNILTKQSQ